MQPPPLIRRTLLLLVVSSWLGSCSSAPRGGTNLAAIGLAPAGLALSAVPVTAGERKAAPGSGGMTRELLLYVPNRVFDLIDVIRARARVGPGLGATARVTRFAQVKVGGYSSVFAGLPGPRGMPKIPWPFGFDALESAALGLLDLSANVGSPNYGMFELGVGAQLGLVGIDVGLDPLEAFDLLAGFFMIDIFDDDF